MILLTYIIHRSEESIHMLWTSMWINRIFVSTDYGITGRVRRMPVDKSGIDACPAHTRPIWEESMKQDEIDEIWKKTCALLRDALAAGQL